MRINQREQEILFSEKSATELDQLWKFYRAESDRYFQLDTEFTQGFSALGAVGIAFLFFGMVVGAVPFMLNGAILFGFAVVLLIASLFAQYKDHHFAVMGDIAFDTRPHQTTLTTDD